MKKKILLTIDTEGPRGEDPILYQIWGKVGDNYYGIPKIIEFCDQYKIKGLFFVDIPECHDYGYEKIKEVVVYILKKGHDVGVHIHPHHMFDQNRHFLWEYTYEEQYKIINDCTDLYQKMTGKKPLCFRAGKYGANNDTLKILSELGYKYDFSEFYSQKWCGIEPHFSYVLPVKHLDLVEVPVTVFKSLSLGKLYKRYDKLEITDNFREIIHILKEYKKTKNNEIIVLFAHSFSFLNYLETPNAPTLNIGNIKNFDKVLKYIYQNRDYLSIGEKDLADIQIAEKDDPKNIVSTKGIVRQILYSFARFWRIRKTNKKAKIITKITTITFISLFVLGLILCGGYFSGLL